MLGLHFCARAFSSCGKRGPLFIAVRGPLTIVGSLVAGHRLQTRRLSSCGSQAQLLHGMWDLPRPGLEPMSPALAGRFSTTAPPGKPQDYCFFIMFFVQFYSLNMSLHYFDKLRFLKMQRNLVPTKSGMWSQVLCVSDSVYWPYKERINHMGAHKMNLPAPHLFFITHTHTHTHTHKYICVWGVWGCACV